ncbi:rRNA methyltransferase 3B, mitochondrial [Ictalurus punctatus]|uniref:rRNA methyltransferase 3B, mitochondrial n=1 Tax=Ictalurus punctatus TaxID=7998 RepID=A0A2D0SXH0_ICTPU|nr:rRNA methyltransferase 3B, mitochondrial [Ictalurus punctatus]
MATLMRCMRGVCTILEPTLTVRISNRYVRTVRCRPPTVSTSNEEEKEDSIDLKSGVKNEQCKGAERLKHACSPSAMESMLNTTRKVSESHHEKTTSKQASRGLSSKPPCFHQVESLRYEKVQPDDKRVSRLVNLARSKKLREQQGKILLEGRRLVCDALEAGVSPLVVFFSTAERLQELPVNKLAHASLVKVKLEDVRIWPDVDAAVDMIAVFKHPEVSQLLFSEEKCGKALPLTLICDNVRDPGNLGAMLCCAAAAGCHSVLLTTGCVDVWEPKVLRAAMGAHFRLPIIPSLSWSDIQFHLPPSATVHVADNSSGSVAELELAGTPRRQKKAGDYGWVSSRHISRKVYCEDEDEEDKVGGSRQASPVLEAQPYHMSWTGNHTAIVIGGETHGLSQEALRLAEETRGRRLLIPMVRGVDSLNAAMAASVLLFEGRRQLKGQVLE